MQNCPKCAHLDFIHKNGKCDGKNVDGYNCDCTLSPQDIHDLNSPFPPEPKEKPILEEKTLINQELQPHKIELSCNSKGKPFFKIEVKSHDPSIATEEAVREYNRLAKACKYPEIKLENGITTIQPGTTVIVQKEDPGVKVIDENDEILENKVKKHKYVSKKSFGYLIHKIRKEKNLSFRQFADKLELYPENIFDWEMEETVPVKSHITDIAELLELDDATLSKLIKAHKMFESKIVQD